jgi:transposase
LDGIPRIEPFIALSLVAEIGDLAQFSSPQHLSYVGLAPSLYASGKRRWTGHITKQGGSSLVRWALVEAAHVASRTERFGGYCRAGRRGIARPKRQWL